jgi:hypothetical protein
MCRWPVIVAALAMVFSLASCYVPDKFVAEIRLGGNGDYALTYIGQLIWAPLFRDIRLNKVAAADIPVKIEEISRDMVRDPGFKQVESLGDGRFKVRYEHEGRLKPSDLYAFVRRNSIILELHASPDGKVAIDGRTLKPSDAVEATTMGLSVTGEFRVITDGKVIEHNATRVVSRGPYLLYIWTIDNVFSPSPHLVMMRKGG